MILREQTACGDSPETKLDLLARTIHLESWLLPFTSFLGSRLRITNCSNNISLLPVNIFPIERQRRSHPVSWQAHIWSYKCDSWLQLFALELGVNSSHLSQNPCLKWWCHAFSPAVQCSPLSSWGSAKCKSQQCAPVSWLRNFRRELPSVHLAAIPFGAN